MISFKANFLKTTNINKYNGKVYNAHEVSLVEIKPKEINDTLALEKIAKFWEYDSFACNIASIARSIYNKKVREDYCKIYALTNQRQNFEKLDDTKILGVVEISNINPTKIKINHMQVNPKFVYSLSNPEYVGCGSTMLDCIKEIFNNKIITLNSKLKYFYEKNGFVLINPEKNTYEYYPDKK